MNDEIDTTSYRTPYNIDIDELLGFRFDNFILKTSETPSKIRLILTDFSTAEFIEDRLGQQFQLSTEQKAEVTRIIRDLLLADLYLGDMVSHISTNLQLDLPTATNIANQIASELFDTVREDIIQLQNQKFGDRFQAPNPENQSETLPEVEPPISEVEPQNMPPPRSTPSLGQSFHEQNMSPVQQQAESNKQQVEESDILETGGNVVDRRSSR